MQSVVRFNMSVSDIYGPDPQNLLTSPEEVSRRLNDILGDKVLGFNPYSVDDDTLLACVERARWLPWPALTQMVVFHFHEIRILEWRQPYEAIMFRVGANPEETHLSVNTLIKRYVYTASNREVHVTVNGRPLTNFKMVERMQRNDYFVSHALPTHRAMVKTLPAYRMHRLKGTAAQRAETIRRAMTEAKLTMLDDILKYPYCPDFLHCRRDFIDYATPIRAALAAIRLFPDRTPSPPPQPET